MRAVHSSFANNISSIYLLKSSLQASALELVRNSVLNFHIIFCFKPNPGAANYQTANSLSFEILIRYDFLVLEEMLINFTARLIFCSTLLKASLIMFHQRKIKLLPQTNHCAV